MLCSNKQIKHFSGLISFEGNLRWLKTVSGNFQNFKVALNPMYKCFKNFVKRCVSFCLSKFDNKKNFTVPFLN